MINYEFRRDNMKKRNIKLCCCSCFLAGVIITAGACGFYNAKNNPTPVPTDVPVIEQTIAPSEPQQEQVMNFDYNVETSWNDNGATCSKVNFKITNVSDGELKNWKVVLNVPDGTQVQQGWNGIYNVTGTEFTVTPESYNGTIAVGQTVDFGCIVRGSGAFSCTVGNLSAEKNGQTVQGGSMAGVAATPIPAPIPVPATSNPVGALSVSGTNIVDANGNAVQLKGASTHGLAWFPQYVNRDAFRTLRDTWGANVVRLAMYTQEYGGYCSGGDRNNLKTLINNGVNYANELGMYAIIDWHILSDGNPNTHKSDAIEFFTEMASKYSGYDNVIYEICNEPNGGVSWDNDIKPYAVDVINAIRQYDGDAIIIVGTPTWSQDVETAAKNPITGQKNIMYSLHFYAATHKDNIRTKMKYALDSNLPIFVTEFSICDASGNGGLDYGSAQEWFDLINRYNVSYVGWNLSNKGESSAFINPSCNKTADWTDEDLSESAKWLKNKMLERQ